ncbi:putative addiction module antidote protein [Microgenomates group bacterium]|nr:putative addiction module antidote protein [Microgenomates group bacterium]
MKAKLSKFNPIDYLKTQEDIAGFLESANETGDTEYIVKALAVAIKAQGLLKTSKETGLNRSGIYHSFFGEKSRNPGILTVAKIANNLGWDLILKQRTKVASS